MDFELKVLKTKTNLESKFNQVFRFLINDGAEENHHWNMKMSVLKKRFKNPRPDLQTQKNQLIDLQDQLDR